MERKRKRKITWIVIILVIIMGIALFSFGRPKKDLTKIVQTEKASILTITEEVSASGKIQPEIAVIIRPDVSGEIIELAVKEGSYVQEGDLLIRIKPDLYQASIDQLQAQLLTQKSYLEQRKSSKVLAEVEYNKQKTLYSKNAISEISYLQAKKNLESEEANVKASEYQIQSVEAQLRRAEEELDLTVIRAPQSGTVSSLAVEQGDRVVGNSQFAGTELMNIARMNAMEVLVQVNENDIVNVSIGDTANIEVDAYSERVFKGEVTEIATSAVVEAAGSSEEVTDYAVKIRIITPHNTYMQDYSNPQKIVIGEGTDKKNDIPVFKTGMSSTVDIQTYTEYKVVAIPIQAVTVRDLMKVKRNKTKEDSQEPNKESNKENNNVSPKEKIGKVVFVVKDGVVSISEVETGISNQTHIHIVSGVQPEEEIVTGSYSLVSRLLNDGDKVLVKNDINRFNRN